MMFPMQYDVTIGIPLFRSADYISRTMDSILSQTFKSIEFLVVDDCGDDGSYEQVEQLCKNHPRGDCIRLLRNSDHQGVGFTRNKIIDEARGSFLFFMDSDDTIEPNTIQLLYEELMRHQAQIAYGAYEIIDGIGKSPTKSFRKSKSLLLGLGQLAVYAFSHVSVFHVSVCNCLIATDFLRATGVRFIDASYWEDMAFTYELLPKVSRAVLLPDITYHYILRPGSLSHYQDREQLDKTEIMNNVSTVSYLKDQCRLSRGEPFLPYMCYNLEMSSFYIVCHILKYGRRISPSFTHPELRGILRHPLRLADVLQLPSKRVQNLVLWMLGSLPLPLFVPAVWVMGKLKRAI